MVMNYIMFARNKRGLGKVLLCMWKILFVCGWSLSSLLICLTMKWLRLVLARVFYYCFYSSEMYFVVKGLIRVVPKPFLLVSWALNLPNNLLAGFFFLLLLHGLNLLLKLMFREIFKSPKYSTKKAFWLIVVCVWPFLDANFPQSGSPCSSSPSSPAVQMRPSSLHGLGSKLGAQRYAKVGRRKSTSSIPPSPLACTSSPQALSPQHSSSPLPSITKTLHSYHGKTLSPPTIVRHGVRPRSTEIPVSPLLKRVQSAEKLSGVFHGDKKAHGPRRHTLEVPHCELDVAGDADVESQYGSDHGRLGAFAAGQIVVMRKLNLSERRDSFKKQEAVQEVSFDEPDERAGQTPATPSFLADTRPKHRAEWMVSNSQSREECVVRRVPLVPQIAVQGSESEELEDWQPCSDEEDEGKSTSGSLDSHPEDKGRPESACSSSVSSDGSSVASKSKGHVTDTEETSSMSPRKGKLRGKWLGQCWCHFNIPHLSWQGRRLYSSHSAPAERVEVRAIGLECHLVSCKFNLKNEVS